jgi:hypothetical protein
VDIYRPADHPDVEDVDGLRSDVRCPERADRSWETFLVNNYLVAAHDTRRGRESGLVPQGKHHAYLAGKAATACGFGLAQMRLFPRLRFSDQSASNRCPICARIVGAGDR